MHNMQHARYNKTPQRKIAYNDMNIMMSYKIRLLVSMFYIYFLFLSDCLKLQKHFNINNVNKKKNQKLTCLVTDSQFFFFFFLWFPISYYSSRTCLCTVNCAQHNLKVIITTHQVSQRYNKYTISMMLGKISFGSKTYYEVK